METQQAGLPLREWAEVELGDWLKRYYPNASGKVEALRATPDVYGRVGHDYLYLRAEVGPGQWRENWLYVPKDVKFKRVSGDVAQELRASVANWQRKNLLGALQNMGTGGAFSGSDPEIFVESKEGGVIPAWEFLPHKDIAAKERKLQIWNGGAQQPSPLRIGGFCYWDGFQAEIATQADTCLAYQVDSIREGLESLWKKTTKQYPGSRLSAKTVVEIPQEMLMGAKQEFVELGCKPSVNAYGLMGMPVENPRELGVRFAGGHYHYGIGTLNPEDAREMVKCADAIVGMASVGIFAEVDNPVRRRYYGLPGEHRLPSHGVEYRVLSNGWMCHPAVAHFVLGLTRKSLTMGRERLRGVMDGCEQEVIQTIQYGDVQGAREYVQRNEKQFNTIMQTCWGVSGAKLGMKMIMEGLGAVVPSWSEVEKNWRMGEIWVEHSGSPKCTWGNYSYGVQ